MKITTTTIIPVLICVLLGLLAFGVPQTSYAVQEVADQFCANITEIPETECEALVVLYNENNGPNWTNNSGWLETNTPCNWYGVTCTDSRVTVLDLDNGIAGNNLAGDLATTIGNLTALTELDLSNNQLSSLPTEIGNLTGLTSLDLSHNQLVTLPTEIGAFKNLTWLTLSSNELRSLPIEIGDLTNLERIYLNYNRLSSLPAEIGNLTKLTWLSLSFNQLSSLPVGIGNFGELTWLSLSFNQLSSLPAEICNLTKLKRLYLAYNQLSSLPTEIACLTNLDALYLASNCLSSLPAEITNLTNLDSLSLEYNKLTISDNNVRTFVTELDPDWAATQTVTPTAIKATALEDKRIELTWTPIQFQEKGGYYEISLSDGGPFTVHGTTADKSVSRYLIEGLAGGATYEMRIRTYTPPHDGDDSDPEMWWDDQRKELWSEYSVVVSATMQEPTPTPTFNVTPTGTPAGTPTPTAITVVTDTPSPTATPSSTNTLPSNNPTTITPTPTLPSINNGSGDPYESNNDCASASSINTDGTAQRHTFHQTNDQDWSTFTAATAGTYRIEVNIPDGSRADVDLYYYDTCDNPKSVDSFTAPFAPGVRLDVVTDSPNQRFYIKSKNYDPAVAGPQITYDLSVRQISQQEDEQDDNRIKPGPAIVVAGRYRIGDALQDNINQSAVAAYDLFAATGRYDSNIYFLATDSALKNVDDEATLGLLEYSITEWAKERLEQENVSQVLTLYMVDHGGPDQFYVDRLNEAILTSDMLHGWLNQLERAFPDLLVNVIIEACKSGSFIDQAGGSISKEGRVIITSANSTYDAYASLYGARFSENFISFLSQERNLGYSFQESRNIVQKFYSKQQPWIDANGNSIPNEPDDISIASLRGVANWSFNSGWPPYIAQVQVMAGRDSGGLRIQAEVRHEHDNPAIKKVWGVVYPPDYIHPNGDPDYSEAGVLSGPALEIIEFTADASTNALFVSTEEIGFTQRGRYQIAIHAQDVDGLEARPVIVEMGGSHLVYLPMISR